MSRTELCGYLCDLAFGITNSGGAAGTATVEFQLNDVTLGESDIDSANDLVDVLANSQQNEDSTYIPSPSSYSGLSDTDNITVTVTVTDNYSGKTLYSATSGQFTVAQLRHYQGTG